MRMGYGQDATAQVDDAIQVGRHSATPQASVAFSKMCPYGTLVDSQVAHFPICQRVAQAFVLEDENGNLRITPPQRLVPGLDALDLLQPACRPSLPHRVVLNGQLTQATTEDVVRAMIRYDSIYKLAVGSVPTPE
ncbi:MAG: hypothetical protein JWO52_4006 [Gammaproteobacteria bacterium]|nr:hypothetical protein [Gammaproteobacteria bacterium]